VLYSLNEKFTAKPVTMIADEGATERDRVMSSDLYRVQRFRVKRVQSVSEIHPAATTEEMSCPSCGEVITNTHPFYIMPPCPKGCIIHPNRFVATKRGIVDRAVAYIALKNESTGTQLIRSYIDSFVLGINDNYSKLQMAANNVIDVSIDAIPIVEVVDADKYAFALWITLVHSKERKAIKPTERELEFRVAREPGSEKAFVFSVFFANIEYMQFMMQFTDYSIQTSFPDLMIKCHDGTKKIIEFEYESRNFDQHKHPSAMTDYIICWIDNRNVEDGIQTIDLSKMVGKKITMISDGKRDN